MKKIAVLAVMMFGFVSAAAAAPKIDVGAGYNYTRVISPGNNYEEAFAKDSYTGYGVFADLYILPSVSMGLERANLGNFNRIDDRKNLTDAALKEIGLRVKYNYDLTQTISLYGLVGIADYEYSYYNEEYLADKIGFNLGIGAKMNFTGNWFAGLDLRYHFLPRVEYKERHYDGSIYKEDLLAAGTGVFVPTVFIGYSF